MSSPTAHESWSAKHIDASRIVIEPVGFYLAPMPRMTTRTVLNRIARSIHIEKFLM